MNGEHPGRAGFWDLGALTGRLGAGRRRIGIAALATMAGAVVLLLLDRQRYRAEAIVAVARPAALLQFDPRFATANGDAASPFLVNNLRVYSELLQSEGMAARVAEALEKADYAESLDRRDLLAALRFRSLADGGLLRIEAAGASPQSAALLAQTWAEVFCVEMRRTYAAAGTKGVTAQRDQAAADLAAAEEALAGGYPLTRRDSLQQRWRALEAGQARRLAAAEQLAAVAADLAAIAQAGGPAGDAGRLAGLQLSLAALSATAATSSTLGLEISLSAGPVDSEALQTLTRQVALRLQSLEAEIETGAADLDAAHQALAEAEGRLSGLRRTRDLAAERYLVLARKADELAVAAAAEATEVRLASPAVASDRLPWRAYALRLLAALALGLTWGGLWALLGPAAESRG